jgi:predicted GH43/DUF377 family glycosyl hydrolase
MTIESLFKEGIALSRRGRISSSPRLLVVSDPRASELVETLKAEGIAHLSQPIASPNKDNPQRDMAFLNGTIACLDGKTYYFIRGFGTDGSDLSMLVGQTEEKIDRNEGRSSIFRATGTVEDPFTLEVEEKPILVPTRKGEIDFEDPRNTYLPNENTFAQFQTVTYLYIDPKKRLKVGYKPVLYLSENLKIFRRQKTSGLWPMTKDWTMFPERVLDPHGNLAYASLFTTRLASQSKKNKKYRERYQERPGIWIAYSKDMLHWYGHKEILLPGDDEAKLGPGAAPIKTKEGWQALIHAVRIEERTGGEIRYITQAKHDDKTDQAKTDNRTRVYSAQSALLNLYRPSIVEKVSGDLVVPTYDWEMNDEYKIRHLMITGAMPALIMDGDTMGAIAAPYGAGDKHTGMLVLTPQYIRDSQHPVPKERLVQNTD